MRFYMVLSLANFGVIFTRCWEHFSYNYLIIIGILLVYLFKNLPKIHLKRHTSDLNSHSEYHSLSFSPAKQRYILQLKDAA